MRRSSTTVATIKLARYIAASPLLAAGERVTTLGFRIAGVAHLNPHRRSS